MATILGNNTNEVLGATGMSIGADRISASGGNDTLVYQLSTAGGADVYYGGTGVDTLELRFTTAEWATHSAKALAMQTLVANAPKSASGSVAAGTNFGKLDFGSGKTVQVFEVESVKIYVDGTEYTGVVTPTNSAVSITSAAQAGTVVENGALTAAGTISFSDADLADVHTVSVAPVAGALGSFVLGSVSEAANTAAGSVNWTYNLNNASAAVQALAQGQTVVETYTVSVSDGHGSVQSQAVTVTITGTNDTPVVTSSAAAAAGAVVESGTAANGTAIVGVATATGQLSSSDVDTGATATWGAVGATAGDYGNFSITEQGKWTYLLDNSLADGLVSGATVTESFTARVTDDKGASVDKVITITITGSEDAVVIGITDQGEVIESGAGEPGTAVAQGKMVDAEVPSDAIWSVFGSPSDMYGSFTIAENGVWTYTLDNQDADTQALTEDTDPVVTENFSVVATFTVNGVEQTVEREVNVVINGTNDAAVITVVGDEDLAVVEAGGVANAIDDNPGASGSLSATDPDGISLFTQATVEGTYGDLNITEAGDWGYTLRNDDTNVQALTAGQHVTDTLTVTAADGTEHNITISITGADDAASMTIVDTNINADDPVEDAKLYDDTVVEAGGMRNGTNTNATASGKFLLTDPDGGALTFHALDADANADFPGSLVNGTFGKFTLNTTTGAWSYSLNNADPVVQALTGADAVTDTLTVYSADGTSSQQITVNITGADDLTASITQDMVTADVLVSEHDDIKDAAGLIIGDRFDAVAGGTLTANDYDGPAPSEFAVPTAAKLKGKYGDFTLTDNADGTAAWTYALAADLTGADGIAGTADDYKDIESLKAGQTDTEVLVVKSLDGGASFAVTVNVKGYNDVAVLDKPAFAADGVTPINQDYEITEAGGVNNALNDDATAGGVVHALDVDTGESGWLAPAAASLNGTYGKFTFNATTGAWTYLLNNNAANVQQLKAGESHIETLTLKSKDGTVLPLEVTVYGANDEGAITVKTGTTPDVSVKEAGGASNKTLGDATASGFLVVTDVDGLADTSEAVFSNDTFSVGSTLGVGVAAAAVPTSLANADRDPVSGSIHGTYGDFTFDITTGKWGYTLDEGKADLLLVNQKAVDSLMVFSGDTSASYQVSVNITGANDTSSIRLDAGADLGVQAGGMAKAVLGVAAPITAEVDAGGQLLGGDPDDNDQDGSSDSGMIAFKTPAASLLAGKFGQFTFNPDGSWTYLLNENDKDTLALRVGEVGLDKLSVSALDGSIYTITVNVAGANNEVVVKTAAVVNPAGNMTYTVLDGDTGSALKMLVTDDTGADAGTVRVYGATTVNDGTVSTLSMPAAAGTSVVEGTLSVTDNTAGHTPVALDAYVAFGTNADNVLDASITNSANGALMAGYGGDDTMTGTDANDYLNGGIDDDSMSGGTGNDKLDGGTGNDTMDGGDGTDNLVGGAGLDYLMGGDDADRLEGGLGKDTLEGGSGDDIFVFLTKTNDMGATNFDVISNFTSGEDSILLAKSLLGTVYTATTAVAAAKFNAGDWYAEVGSPTAAYAADDRVIFDTSTGTLWYDADGSAAANAKVKIAVLTGVADLDAIRLATNDFTDFQFV